MFKARKAPRKKNEGKILWGTQALISTKQQRFEFLYIRVFKKLFRRRFVKRKSSFVKPRFWMYLFISRILSAKSRNARMGAGVGKIIRTCLQLRLEKVLVCFINYSPVRIKLTPPYLQLKCSLSLRHLYNY